jgi:hypothetical protein
MEGGGKQSMSESLKFAERHPLDVAALEVYSSLSPGDVANCCRFVPVDYLVAPSQRALDCSLRLPAGL